ncbi:MAG TPA: hypothetical protein VGL56_13015 [Fimbriimonadaceae bacterium]
MVYILSAGLLGALLFFGLPIWHLLHGLGVLDAKVMEKYNASNEKNLMALRTALMEYHESEGQFPDAAHWMDAIKNRVKVDNMEQSEVAKKFINPLYPASSAVFGYALNDAASNKYKGDLKPNTLLLFDSSDTSWDAHGDPKKLKPASKSKGGDEGITVDGKIVHLP